MSKIEAAGFADECIRLILQNQQGSAGSAFANSERAQEVALAISEFRKELIKELTQQ